MNVQHGASLPCQSHYYNTVLGGGPSVRSPASDDTSSSDSDSIHSDDTQDTHFSETSSPSVSYKSWDGERYAQGEQCSDVPSLPRQNLRKISVESLINNNSDGGARCNPRRTQSSAQSSVCQTQSGSPPKLSRQCDRAQNFVENLVDTSTQMIEVIWPLTQTRCDKEHLGGRNLIGLRTFIQEVLRRSKTSYYTLQVALYYLVLIKPHIPEIDFTQQQTEISHARRAMQCGRRMFLAALILASKYLQDRNYSARAWSKISGLKVNEINTNEIAFLTAVDWNIHIPEAQFHRWSNIVLRYAPSQSCNPNAMQAAVSWRDVIPRLTPELEEMDFSRLAIQSPPNSLKFSPASLSEMDFGSPISADNDKTPTPAMAELVASSRPATVVPFQPCSPRIPGLPTPAMTPQMACQSSYGASTWSRGQAMRQTMPQIHQQVLRTLSNEAWPACSRVATIHCGTRRPLARVLSNTSVISSPESMVSDVSSQSSHSSRTSRSSSISSTAPFIGAQTDNCEAIFNANHRAQLALLNQPYRSWGNQASGSRFEMNEDNLESMVAFKHDAEHAAAERLMALRFMQASSNVCSGQPSRSYHHNQLQDEVRRSLSAAQDTLWKDGVVLPDQYQAQSFVLARPQLLSRDSSPSRKRSATGTIEQGHKRQRLQNGVDLLPYQIHLGRQ